MYKIMWMWVNMINENKNLLSIIVKPILTLAYLVTYLCLVMRHMHRIQMCKIPFWHRWYAKPSLHNGPWHPMLTHKVYITLVTFLWCQRLPSASACDANGLDQTSISDELGMTTGCTCSYKVRIRVAIKILVLPYEAKTLLKWRIVTTRK